MISIDYYFKVKVSYQYRISSKDTFKTDTTEYEIIIKNTNSASYDDIRDEICDLARSLNKEEYGDLPHYEYVGLEICEKKTIYIKK